MAIRSLSPDWKRTRESPISGRDANAERLKIKFGRCRAIVQTHVTWLAQSVRRLSKGLIEPFSQGASCFFKQPRVSMAELLQHYIPLIGIVKSQHFH
jgi:hypothetical protein